MEIIFVVPGLISCLKMAEAHMDKNPFLALLRPVFGCSEPYFDPGSPDLAIYHPFGVKLIFAASFGEIGPFSNFDQKIQDNPKTEKPKNLDFR